MTYSKYSLNRLTDIRQELEKQFDKMQEDINLLSCNGLKKQELNKWDKNYLSSFYESYIKTEYDLNNKRKQYEKEFNEIKEIHETNISIIENNKKVLQQAVRFMNDLGLSETEYYQKRKYGKNYTKTSEWKTSIEKMIPTTDGFSYCESRFRDLNNSLDRIEEKFRKEKIQKETELKRKKEKEQKLEKIISLRININNEYNSNIDGGFEDIKEFLLQKDKFLNLAYSMESVRGYWGNGCGIVREAIESLDTKNELENKIYECLSECCEDFDDGRVFRDCEYSYGVIYGMADKKVYEFWTELCDIKYTFDDDYEF